MSKKNRANKRNKERPTVSNINIARKWTIGLILGVTFLAFANSLTNGFAYDDTSFILDNELVRSFSNIPTVFTKELWFYRVLKDKNPNAENEPTTPYYRPVFSVYQMVCWAMFEDSPFGWHMANLLVHLLVVYFAFLIMEKITGDLRISAIAVILFAIHPLRSESVAWICGLSDPLLALLLLPSFYLYMFYREKGQTKFLLAALGLFLIGAFMKEAAVSLPVFIVAYEVFIINQEKSLKERIKPAAIYSLMFMALIVVYFLMRRNALGFWLNDSSFTHSTNFELVLTIPLVVCKYIGLLLWPFNLSLFHATPMVQSPLSARFILPVLALTALAPALWLLRKSLTARFAILWFFIHLLPVLNLRAFDENFLVQERYVYIPSIGFSLLAGMALVKLPIEKWVDIGNRKTAQVVIVTIICLLLGSKTLAQNIVWKDDTTLYSNGAQVAADQLIPHYVLGHHYIKLQQPEKSVPELEQVLKMDPDNLISIINLAPAHLQLYIKTLDRSHIDRAIELCEKGLSQSDGIAPLWDTLGHAYTFDTEHKNFDRARAFFTRALNIQPTLFISNFHMGATYVKEGRYSHAVPFLELARQQEPTFAETYKFLAYAYENLGRIREAVDQLDRYLRLQPNGPDAAQEAQHLATLRARLQNESP